MNKMMIATVAAAMAATSFADVSSANTVGYMSKSYTTQYPSLGGMFLQIASEDGTWCFNDVKIEGCDPTSDMLQVLKPDTAGTAYAITYLDADWAEMMFGDRSLAGWYDATELTPKGEEPFAAEQGFLASFGDPITLTFAGQVNPAKAPVFDSKGLQYPMICNFLPRRIQWKELKTTGFDPTSDMLQVLKPDTAGTAYAVTYLDADWAEMMFGDRKLAGWYDATELTPYDEEYIEPGDGFLCSFGDPVTITFPAAM